MADLYERHRQAVEQWREACQNVEFAEKQRDEARAALDRVGQELLASCADSKRIKPIVKRGRKSKFVVEKVNGLAGPESLRIPRLEQ